MVERVNEGGKVDKDGGIAGGNFAHGTRPVSCHGDGNLQGLRDGESERAEFVCLIGEGFELVGVFGGHEGQDTIKGEVGECGGGEVGSQFHVEVYHVELGA